MKRTTRLRLGISTAIFFIAAVVGWHGVSAVPVAPGTSLPVLPAKLPAAATVANAAGKPTLLGAENDAVMKLEQQLLRTIDPTALSHNGERLMELCLDEHPEDLPGSNVASYSSAWAKQDPQGMFEWFQRRGGFSLPARDANTTYGFLNQIFLELTKKDPDEAITAALSCPTKNDCAEALIHVIEQLRKTDPARAASLASEHLAKLETAGGYGWSANGKNYGETWDFLSALPPGKSRGKVISRFFEKVIRHDSKDSVQLWKNMPDVLRREIVAGGLNSPGLESTEQLEGISGLQREHIESTGDAMTTRQWLGTGAREWAGRDPAAAVAWAQQNLKGQPRLEGTAQLFSAGAAQDFAATLRVWQSLPDGILKAHATGHLAAGAPEARKAETEALLESLPPTDRAIANTAKKAAEAAERQRKNRLEELRKPVHG